MVDVKISVLIQMDHSTVNVGRTAFLRKMGFLVEVYLFLSSHILPYLSMFDYHFILVVMMMSVNLKKHLSVKFIKFHFHFLFVIRFMYF